ncbi:PREDICTED: bZIP transcription factor 11-like [Ipomoea nil]|uniref:bZIP transcription factor 11-like n=1 Tax=Ipomoea nil TaxID=35883 RepID=UPI000901D253|nr:PREDICTED: bZIP transcription factor 11-like [Ipomoea nil]
MASSGVTSPGSSVLQSSGSEEDLQTLMDQRKRKRMISNRESARRSRMRKQKHLDDLMAQVSQLRKENNQIVTAMNATTQQYLNVEAHNSILRAQVAELSHRLEALNEIVSFLNANNGGFAAALEEEEQPNYSCYGNLESPADAFFATNNNSWNFLYSNQPIITSASADILQY